jgi:ABC-type phosphate/phosphonate transport system substrate-binding protein
LSEDARQKITSALIGMSNDPEGKKILETLRLKGFAN